MHEEEIVIAPGLFDGCKLMFGVFTFEFDHIHTYQAGYTAVHGVNCDAGSLQPVSIFVGLQARIGGKTTQRESIGFGFIG